MNQTLFEAMILGLSGFTLLGVVSLKIDMAAMMQSMENSKERIKKLESELDDLWKQLNHKGV